MRRTLQNSTKDETAEGAPPDILSLISSAVKWFQFGWLLVFFQSTKVFFREQPGFLSVSSLSGSGLYYKTGENL